MPIAHTPAPDFFRGAWCRDFRAAGHRPDGFAWFLAIQNNVDSTMTAVLHEWQCRPTQGTFGEATTVRLASHVANEPFKIDHLYVEVVAAPTLQPNTTGLEAGIARVTASIVMDGVVELDGHAASSELTGEMAISSGQGATNVRGNERRYTFKLSPGDAPAGLEMTPVITFSGCRIRRVTAVCSSIGWS